MAAVRRQSINWNPVGWLFGILVLAVGVANLLLVHPVPAAGYALASLVYFPPVGTWLEGRCGISIHPLVKLSLAVVIVMFTLSVSDLGDMID